MKQMVVIFLFLLFICDSHANTVTVATGWRAPFSGDSLPEEGTHSKVVRLIFKRMGYEVKLVFMSWQRAYEITKIGDAAATFSWARTPRMESDLLFPKSAIAEVTEVGFYKKTRFPQGLSVASIEDIVHQGLKVVGVSSYWYEELFASMGVEAHMVPFSPLAWRMLAAERVDLFVESRVVGLFESQKALGVNKHGDFAHTDPLRVQKLYLVFSKKHKSSGNLLQLYNQTVDTLKKSMPGLIP